MKLREDSGRTRSKSRGLIQIAVGPMLADVSGHLPHAVLDGLTEIVRTPDYSEGGGYTYTASRETFYERRGQRLVMPSGLVPRLVRELQRLDVSYELDDSFDCIGRSPVIEPTGGYNDPYDQEFADVIGQHPRGQVMVSSLAEALDYIALVARCSPTSTSWSSPLIANGVAPFAVACDVGLTGQ